MSRRGCHPHPDPPPSRGRGQEGGPRRLGPPYTPGATCAISESGPDQRVGRLAGYTPGGSPMVHAREACPLDRSRLVFLSGSYGREGLDLSVHYCPRCDVAFVFLTPAGAATPPEVLEWHRGGGRLEPRAKD